MAKQKTEVKKTEAEVLADMVLERKVREVLSHTPSLERAAIILRMRVEDLKKYVD